jgi:hypothetical protein
MMRPALAESGTALETWLRLVRAEYRESPGLRLTRAQIRRFWNLDDDLCDAVLERLEAQHFLKQLAGGQWGRTGV